MVTIEELKNQIKAQQDKIDRVAKKQQLEREKSSLSKQLKILKRSPGTSKNIELATRTARGFKRLASIGGRALIKQAKLIKEQQLREDATFSKSQKNITNKLEKNRKTLRKSSKKRRKILSKKSGGKSFTFTLN